MYWIQFFGKNHLYKRCPHYASNRIRNELILAIFVCQNDVVKRDLRVCCRVQIGRFTRRNDRSIFRGN